MNTTGNGEATLFCESDFEFFRDPRLYPFQCTNTPPCDKLFSSQKSENDHRRNGRCKTFKCSKCGEKHKDKSIYEAHQKICQEIFGEPCTESVLAEITFEGGIDLLQEAVIIDLGDTLSLGDTLYFCDS